MAKQLRVRDTPLRDKTIKRETVPVNEASGIVYDWGKMLKIARLRNSMTATDVATHLGYSLATSWTKFENHRVTPSLLLVPGMMDVLGISFQEFTGIATSITNLTSDEEELVRNLRRLEGKEKDAFLRFMKLGEPELLRTFSGMCKGTLIASVGYPIECNDNDEDIVERTQLEMATMSVESLKKAIKLPEKPKRRRGRLTKVRIPMPPMPDEDPHK